MGYTIYTFYFYFAPDSFFIVYWLDINSKVHEEVCRWLMGSEEEEKPEKVSPTTTTWKKGVRVCNKPPPLKKLIILIDIFWQAAVCALIQYVQVTALPKGAVFEVMALAHTNASHVKEGNSHQLFNHLYICGQCMLWIGYNNISFS